jgi:hypothetical protein
LLREGGGAVGVFYACNNSTKLQKISENEKFEVFL